jgi:hypothetical protein
MAQLDVLGCDDVVFLECEPFVFTGNDGGDIVTQNHADSIMNGHAFHGWFSLAVGWESFQWVE